MKLNRKWLNEEFVDLSGVPDREFVETMTIAGQKVETYERLDAELRNVVVGRVVSITRHTNSDHMWVCQIDVGAGEPVQIVTGAQNVHEGDLVPVAQHNSWLPGGVHITKGKLRGEVSNGMLCSLKELGLTLNDFPYAIEDGIWILQEDCKPGDDINTVIGNDDTVVDFEITNNRPDCYSILGLAREAAAAFNKPMRHHDPVVRGGAAGELSELLEVEVPAEDLCRRYTARMVRNVKIAPSPKWLRQRLRANGVRPINNIVDITNYVMLEYGQPMHAFDYRYVGSGKIIVRRSEPGEALTTLDGNVRTLTPGMLVIADETKPIGLAGIMGGENSEIMDDTVDVVFESANFNGTSIRQTALALGMRTEASGKFEKNIDPLLTLPAVDRACELVELLGAGEVMDGVIDVLNDIPEPRTIELEPDRINALLGTDISEADMVEYLNGPADSEWGRRRAANGHPEPYGVRYIGIGNEEVLFNGDRADEYDHYVERFNLLHDAIKGKDPSVKLISTAWWRADSPSMERTFRALDGKADYWDYHPWADQLASGREVEAELRRMRELFLRWNPSTTMKCVIFEENGNRHDMQRVLGHVTLQNAVRRMGDFVLTSCAANALQPYRQNDNGWDQGQVFFTPSQVWGMPPYYAQQMAAAHHRPLTVGCGVEGADGVLDVTATRSREAGSVVLHIANTGAEPLRVGLRVDGMGKVSQARMVSLSGDLDAVNTPEEPRRIAPVGRELPARAAQTVDIAPYSYTIVVLDE